jgi:hypothetical protein
MGIDYRKEELVSKISRDCPFLSPRRCGLCSIIKNIMFSWGKFTAFCLAHVNLQKPF